MGNNKGTEKRSILIVENYLQSGMGLVEYAELIGINRSTIKSMCDRYERISGKPLPEKNLIRNEELVIQFKKDMEEGKLPDVEIKAQTRKEIQTMDSKIINEEQDQKSKEETRPAGRPGLTYKEAHFSFGMKEDEFNVLRAFCTIKNKSIKSVMQEAIIEYLNKPENETTINEAKKLVKLIEKSSK